MVTVSGGRAGDRGGGLRVTNPADSTHRRQPTHPGHMNGYGHQQSRHQTLKAHHHQQLQQQQPGALPDTPRRHTVTIGGMDLEWGNTPQNQVQCIA